METGFDWNEAWKEAQKLRRKADDSGFWDKRAPSFAQTAGTSEYATVFLQRAAIKPGDVVFDMGCGSGTLALPLARDGHEVYACDFSPVMLELMMERAKLDGVSDLIHPVEVSWGEDWSKRDLPVCDVAVASRSIATNDMHESLTKLAAQAKRRVCLTLGTDYSPRVDEVLFRAMGRSRKFAPDYVFGMNILWQMGFMPDLSYILSSRSSDFESFEEAIDKTCEVTEASSEERERLIEYSKAHLHERADEEGKKVWSYDHDRITSWAFISWDK